MFKKNKIIFVYPKIKSMPSAKTHAPQAFLSIAAFLAQKGYQPELVDTRVGEDYRQVLSEKIKEGALYVGITAMTGFQAKHGLEIARYVKVLNKDIPVVVGGLHGSLAPADFLVDGSVDLVAIGEGEELSVDLADYFSNPEKDSLDKINGIAFNKQGQIYFTKKRDFINFKRIPTPAWDLIKDKIPNYIIDGNIDVLTSRGCPHRCKFCYNDTYHKRSWRGREVENVLAEIDLILSYTKALVKRINFIDDNFFTDKKRALSICEGIKEKRLKMHADIRFNYVSEELFDGIYKNGADSFYFGVESGSQRVLDLMCKDITIDNIKKTISIMRNYKVNSVFSFLAGYPGEDVKDIKQTLSLASYIYKNIKNSQVLMNIFTVYPGTHFFEKFKNELKDTDIDFRNWYTAKNKPWIKEKGYVETICTLFRFLNLPPASSHFGILKMPIIFILHKLAKFRVRRKFFIFPIEFKAANYFIQRYKLI